MRKDYMDVADADVEDETAFVERYWSDVWKKMGGPSGAYKRVARQPEYRIMAPVLNTLPQGAKMLDAGCGLGDWTLYLTEQGFDVTGLDISQRTVEILQEKFPQAAFACADIRNLSIPDNDLDVYFSWGVFEHFEDGLQPCILEAWRVLKPGGYLFITVPYDSLRQALLGHFASFRKSGHSPKNLRFYQWRLTRKELATELMRGGFEVQRVKGIHKRQGVIRALQSTFGLPYQWLFSRVLSAALAVILPSGYFAHMQVAVARKPLETEQ